MNRAALICRTLDRPLAHRCPRTRAGHDMTIIPDVPYWDARWPVQYRKIEAPNCALQKGAVDDAYKRQAALLVVACCPPDTS